MYHKSIKMGVLEDDSLTYFATLYMYMYFGDRDIISDTQDIYTVYIYRSACMSGPTSFISIQVGKFQTPPAKTALCQTVELLGLYPTECTVIFSTSKARFPRTWLTVKKVT